MSDNYCQRCNVRCRTTLCHVCQEQDHADAAMRTAIAAAVAAERERCVEINRVRLLPDFPGEVGPDCSEPECIACWATKAIESGESAESFTARVEALREKWRADDESGAQAPREG